MPKLTDRERLTDLESRQRKLAQELDDARRTLRARYASMIADLAVEGLTERDFRDLLGHALRVGGAAALAAIKLLPSVDS